MKECPFSHTMPKTGIKIHPSKFRSYKVDVKDQPLIDTCLECKIIPCKMDKKKRVAITDKV